MILFGFAGKLKTEIAGLTAGRKGVQLVVTAPGFGDDGLGYRKLSRLSTGTATENAVVAHNIKLTLSNVQ